MKSAKKISFRILFVITVLLLTGFWVFSAYIQAHTSKVSLFYPNRTQNITRIISECGSGDFIPNSYDAFENAANDSFFSAVLTDIRATKDGVFVCSSSDTPFIDKSVSVSNSSYDEIKDLSLASDLPFAKSNICLLSDFLSVCSEAWKIAVIRFDFILDGNLSSSLISETYRFSKSGIIFCSHSLKCVEKFTENKTRTNFFVYASGSVDAHCLSLMGNHFAVDVSFLNEKTVKRAHEKNEFVYVSGVDNRTQTENLRSLNVDFILFSQYKK